MAKVKAKQWSPRLGANATSMFSNPKASLLGTEGSEVPKPTVPDPFGGGYYGRPGWGKPTVWTANRHYPGSQYSMPMGGVGQGITAGGRGVVGNAPSRSYWSGDMDPMNSPLNYPSGPGAYAMTPLQMNYEWYKLYNRQNEIPEEEWLSYEDYVKGWVKAIQNISPTGIPTGIQGFNQFKKSGKQFRAPGGHPPEEEEGESGLQQMPMWGYGQIVNQRY